jgi:hypothetical protein
VRDRRRKQQPRQHSGKKGQCRGEISAKSITRRFGARASRAVLGHAQNAPVWGTRKTRRFGARASRAGWGTRKTRRFGARAKRAGLGHAQNAPVWGTRKTRRFGARASRAGWGTRKTRRFGARAKRAGLGHAQNAPVLGHEKAQQWQQLKPRSRDFTESLFGLQSRNKNRAAKNHRSHTYRSARPAVRGLSAERSALSGRRDDTAAARRSTDDRCRASAASG